MAKTVKEHLEQADQLKSHVDDADKLVRKLRDELDMARAGFEFLKDFATPDFAKKNAGFKFFGEFKDDTVSMRVMIEARITKINILLGDRA